MTGETRAVLDALDGTGLLLLQHRQLPNVVTLVTGQSLRTSWWSHPEGKRIFAVVRELAEHPDVLATKLLDRKVTFVHRRLWSVFLAVATSEEPWQRRGLSPTATEVLAAANEAGGPVAAHGAVVKEIEMRLLAHTREVHGAAGRHEVMVEPWAVWARHAKVEPLRSAEAATQQIEEAAQAMGADLALLPWHRRGGK